MAITISSEPSTNLFAYRPLPFTITSDSTAIVRTIADVYINGTYAATLENSPDLDSTATFTYDVQGIVQDNLDIIDITSGDGVTDQDVTKTYQARFYEVLTAGDGTFSTTWAEDGAGTGSVNSTALDAYNGTLKHNEANSTTPFKLNGTYGQLSRIVAPIRIKRNDYAYVTSITYNAINQTYRTVLKQYDSSNSLISTTNSGTTVITKDIQLGRYDTSGLATNCAWFTLQIQNTAPVSMTDAIRFNVVEDCNSEFVSVYWFNSVGGMDYHLFEGRVQKKVRSRTTS